MSTCFITDTGISESSWKLHTSRNAVGLTANPRFKCSRDAIYRLVVILFTGCRSTKNELGPSILITVIRKFWLLDPMT